MIPTDDEYYDDTQYDDEKYDIYPNVTHPYNPSVDLPLNSFCHLVEKLPKVCYSKSIIEYWNYNASKIANLTLEDVITKIDVTKRSPETGLRITVEPELSGIERDIDNRIISATSVQLYWFVSVNYTITNHNDFGNVAGTEQWVTLEVLKWERKFIEIMKNLENELTDENFHMFYNAASSYGDVSANAIFQDKYKLGLGVIIMLIYMIILFSKYNKVEFRAIISFLGIFCVGLSCLVAVGVTSFLGLKLGAVHGPLPFILLGINSDDIFVLMGHLKEVKRLHSGESIPVQIGLCLKNSAVSVSVTTMTNIVSFAVGAMTAIPSLRIFSLNAVAGVVAMFFLIISFFTAVMTLDEKRIASKRDGIVPCLKHKNFVTHEKVEESDLQTILLKFIYSKVILTTPGKILIICALVAITGYAVDGLTKLKVEFNPIWVLSDNSYLVKYFNQKELAFPEAGYDGSVYTGRLNYTKSMQDLINLSHKLSNEKDKIQNFDSWTLAFDNFTKIYYSKDLVNTTENEWKLYLTRFLFSEDGGKYQRNLIFTKPLKCDQPAPNIKMSSFDFQFKLQHNIKNNYRKIKREIYEFVENANLQKSGDGFATVWARIFLFWQNNEIVEDEFTPNLITALIGVMICIAIFVPDPRCIAIIFISITLGLVNIMGYMEKWNLTINGISLYCLELAIGLTVDFSAHFSHCFMTTAGDNRKTRIVESARKIGGAIFHTGLTTLIGVSFIGTANSYGPRSMFKVICIIMNLKNFNFVKYLFTDFCFAINIWDYKWITFSSYSFEFVRVYTL